MSTAYGEVDHERTRPRHRGPYRLTDHAPTTDTARRTHMTRDTADRRSIRRQTPYRGNDRDTDQGRRDRTRDGTGVPLVPETTSGSNPTETYRPGPFELALMEDSE